MKVILATGIYPPEIGGPATYVKALAGALMKQGTEVKVITYGGSNDDPWDVINVRKGIYPICRWFRYARALKKHAANADAVYAFSSVSVGIPVMLAKLKCKKILRLGGDFFWERYTDRGGEKNLREWHESKPFSRGFMGLILSKFDHVVFSTKLQEEIYENNSKSLPKHSVIENAIPDDFKWSDHIRREPFRLLAMSRLVRFKNLESLVRAVPLMPSEILLTIIGDGPRKNSLQNLVHKLNLDGRVAFTEPIHGKDKQLIFDMHEVLISPSFTDISPNVALEAVSAGLPVLITKETGLSKELTKGMALSDLRTPEQIANAVKEIYDNYPKLEKSHLPDRSWGIVAEETLKLFKSL